MVHASLSQLYWVDDFHTVNFLSLIDFNPPSSIIALHMKNYFIKCLIILFSKFLAWPVDLIFEPTIIINWTFNPLNVSLLDIVIHTKDIVAFFLLIEHMYISKDIVFC